MTNDGKCRPELNIEESLETIGKREKPDHLILQTGTNEITNNSEKTVIEEKVIKLVGLASRLKSENVLKIAILNQKSGQESKR